MHERADHRRLPVRCHEERGQAEVEVVAGERGQGRRGDGRTRHRPRAQLRVAEEPAARTDAVARLAHLHGDLVKALRLVLIRPIVWRVAEQVVAALIVERPRHHQIEVAGIREEEPARFVGKEVRSLLEVAERVDCVAHLPDDGGAGIRTVARRDHRAAFGIDARGRVEARHVHGVDDGARAGRQVDDGAELLQQAGLIEREAVGQEDDTLAPGDLAQAGDDGVQGADDAGGEGEIEDRASPGIALRDRRIAPLSPERRGGRATGVVGRRRGDERVLRCDRPNRAGRAPTCCSGCVPRATAGSSCRR